MEIPGIKSALRTSIFRTDISNWPKGAAGDQGPRRGGAMPRGHAFQSLVATLRSWQKEKKGELRYAIVRHAERADTAWDYV